jgi:catechol 2,3-dioxygenase-like lactoylglutathione lyase family enzyme
MRPSEMRAIGLNHVSVPARDLDESTRFYEELFGMERLPTPRFGFPVSWLRVGELQLHLFERGEPTMYHHFGLEVDDFEGFYLRAKELGLTDDSTFGSYVYELPGGCVQLYVRDPAGNLVEIDWPDVGGLDPVVVDDLRRLADRVPQDDEARAATLFAGRATRRARAASAR